MFVSVGLSTQLCSLLPQEENFLVPSTLWGSTLNQHLCVLLCQCQVQAENMCYQKLWIAMRDDDDTKSVPTSQPPQTDWSVVCVVGYVRSSGPSQPRIWHWRTVQEPKKLSDEWRRSGTGLLPWRLPSSAMPVARLQWETVSSRCCQWQHLAVFFFFFHQPLSDLFKLIWQCWR